MNLGKAAKKVLGALAPVLGVALGGPVGGIAGKFLSDALGVTPGDAVGLNIALASPENQVKLAQIDADFKADMASKGIDLETIHAASRKDARRFAEATSMAPQLVLGVVFVTGYFVVIIGLMVGELDIPEGSGQLVSALIGVLTAGVIKVLDFFLGSSAGSKMKSVIMGNNK
jgi:hypothetical protein